MSDSLKQAVKGLEVAWRRLREVLDGPDVAAALVERSTYNDVRTMNTAPLDGTWIIGHIVGGGYVVTRWRASANAWRDQVGYLRVNGDFIGWSPVKHETDQCLRPMSTAPRDGTWVTLHFDTCYKVRAYCRSTFQGGPKHWGFGPSFEHNLENRCQPIGWSPVTPETNQWPNPMSTAPRDGTPITLHHVWGDRIQALYNVSHRGWVDRQNNLLREEGEFVGWSPVK